MLGWGGGVFLGFSRADEPIPFPVAGYTLVPPFRPTGKSTDLLVLRDPESCSTWSKESLPLSTTQSLDLETDLQRDHHRWDTSHWFWTLFSSCYCILISRSALIPVEQPGDNDRMWGGGGRGGERSLCLHTRRRFNSNPQ